jgi:type IV pilus assembly protein PilB
MTELLRIGSQFGGGLRVPLGEVLLKKGRIEESDLVQAVAESAAAGKRLGEYLVANGIVYEDEVAQALADQFELPYVSLASGMVDREAARLIPEAFARKLNVLGVRATEHSLTVAVADPTNVLAADELRLVVKRDVRLVVSGGNAIRKALDTAYRSDGPPAEPHEHERSAGGPAHDANHALIDLSHSSDSAPAIEIVNTALRRAIELSASDVHFIPRRGDLLIRVRVDGVMRDLDTINISHRAAVTARLKVMGKLDIAERRLPQDGRASVAMDEAQTDLRVAALPSTWGESIVVRILYLENKRGVRTVEDLRLDAESEGVFRHALRQPMGAILICGPTGSGKTVTLYAALRALNDGDRSIVTIEDPVEASLQNTVQVQVNEKAGLTFARGLRTILRSDPDVILVGEIRDLETAEITMRAAMTGHQVLSSVHAQSAPAAITRLREIGLPHALLASSLSCVIGQRLLRKPCPTCWKGTLLTCDELTAAGLPADGEYYRPRGCADCGRTGHLGRVAVFEALLVTDEIRAAAIDGSTPQIAEAARQQGLNTLRDNALRLCVAGETTVDEVMRVCGDAHMPGTPGASAA